MQKGRCTNFGICSLADRREAVAVMPGQKVICPECGEPLLLVADGKGSSVVRLMGIVFTIFAVLLCAYGIRNFVSNSQKAKGELASIPVPREPGFVKLNPSQPAEPQSSVFSTPRIQTNLFFLYEKSAQQWLLPSFDAINRNGGGGQIAYDYRGSREGMQSLLFGSADGQGDSQPALWVPADIYWVTKANETWKRGDGRSLPAHASPLLSKPDVLLSTQIVFVMWEDRADVFQRAMGTARYKGRTWHLVHDLSTQGWKSIGGSAAWGRLKMAQSDPLRSNSGMVVLALLLAEWNRVESPNRAVPPTDPRFVAWMRSIEQGVVANNFADTTSNALKDFVNGGKSTYDMTIGYEQNAIAAADSRSGIHLIYPEPTANISFPIAVLQGFGMTPEKSRDAENVKAYLLRPEVQESAIRYGFRPGISTLRRVVADKLNTPRRARYGFRMDAPVAPDLGSTDTRDTLQYIWKLIFRPNS